MNIIRLLTATIVVSSMTLCRAQNKVSVGNWQLSYENGLNIRHGGNDLVSNLKAEYSLDGKIVSTGDYKEHRCKKATLKDAYGKGVRWSITYTAPSLPTLIQTFRIYPDYLLAQIQLKSTRVISTNYMAPLVTEQTGSCFRQDSLRTLFVPYDNDSWIRYASMRDCGHSFRSYEVTAIYDAPSRKGLVIGAINHDVWKNGIDLSDESKQLKAFSGVADALTRDHHRHGSISGTELASASFMLGVFADWREGMDTYARLNTLVAPPRHWGKAVPIGWNSWGALQFKVNHQNSTAVSKFIADNLQNHSFHNADGLVYTGLDSGWNSFSEDELKDFADQCRSRHQVACIYWTPFTDWGKDPERTVPDLPEYKYKDIYLYADGKPQELDGAYAIDPTHPAVKKMMEKTAALFRRCGYQYVKMDFMTHGRLEADHWYARGITTGTQAYCYGMQLLDSIFSDMYINLSISPIFPSPYAQSRRIACDAWNKIKDTEYTMNALSYGWWVGKLYDFNDADHVVLRDATEGENRARITSSVITGIFITGDDFSADSVAIERARKYLTNPDINAIATGRSFRPVEGNDDRSESLFVRHESNGDVYLACFNYTENAKSYRMEPSRIGLSDFDHYAITELWSHQKADLRQPVNIPAHDAKVFRLRKQ
jgi:alpha-galactosidase